LNLIIVEGIPGSGKSTTARFIALQSERNGFKTKLYHESTFEHPIIMQNSISNYTNWMDDYVSNWDKFLEDHTGDETTFVLESVLFQTPILYLLHKDIDRDEIVQFIEKIYSRLSDMNCRLIFLFQNNPWVGINRMMEARGGKNWLNHTYEKYKHEPYYINRDQGNAEVHLEFLNEYAQIAHTAYIRSEINTIAIDNTEWDWTEYHSRLHDYLRWTYYPDQIIPISELKKYSGLYHSDEINLNLIIEIKDNELIIFGDQRLKPKEQYKFYLDSISIVVSFMPSPSGKFDQLLIEEKDLVGNHKEEGTRFVRVSEKTDDKEVTHGS